MNSSVSTLAINLYDDPQLAGAKSRRRKRLVIGVVGGLLLGAVIAGLAIGLQKNSGGMDSNDPLEDEIVQVSEEPLALTKGATYAFPKSALGQLFILYKDNKNLLSEHDIPAARSYDGLNWEPLFPELLRPQSCNNASCVFVIPSDGNYSVVQANRLRRSVDAVASDFLAQATFGPTEQLIRQFLNGSVDVRGHVVRNFIIQQMNLPASLHREYYRTRASPQVGRNYTFARRVVRPTRGPCEINSRWERFALDMYDSYNGAELTIVNENQLFVNGELRTEVSAAFVQNLRRAGAGPWYLCGIGNANRFKSVTSGCSFQLVNPTLSFNKVLPPQQQIVSNSTRFRTLDSPIDGIFLLNSSISKCEVNEKDNLYAKDINGVWYRFHLRLKLYNNVVPLNSAEEASFASMNVPRNFLNEDTCRPSLSVSPIQFRSSRFNLTSDNIRRFYELSGLYVNYVTGLKPTIAPCISPQARFSRQLRNCSNPASLSVNARNFLENLIRNADKGGNVVDIVTNKNAICSTLRAGSQIQIGNTCWTHEHEDYMNVYDFTTWSKIHKGGETPFRLLALSGSVNLNFPHSDEMTRWNANSEKFPFLGVFGQTVDFLDLPSEVQQFKVAEYFQAITPGSGSVSYTERCGSIGEIANDPRKGNHFAFLLDQTNELRTIIDGPMNYEARVNVYSNIALKAEDQLRQKIAWALAQIFVINENNIGLSMEQEPWVNYYDIFVRNAFGNYFDVMKEVSFSPMMGLMLSYHGGRSYQRNNELFGIGKYPDENYAREIMQLFTIGLWKLNDNGTRVLKGASNVLETYTNEDIEDIARIWTGFRSRLYRNNIECTSSGTNFVDPMTIIAADHDTFPKQGLNGFHIGDGYPLCSSLPKLAFLRKGATFRFLGSRSTPFLNAVGSVLVLNTSSSQLYKVICNPDSNQKCQLESTVVLDSNLQCNGLECQVDTLKLVQINFNATDRVFYEYVQRPCIQLEFFENGRTIVSSDRSRPICADLNSTLGSAACCSTTGTSAISRVRFFGEMLSYESARNVCASFNQRVCVFNSLSNFANSGTSKHWTSDSCKTKVQVFADGSVGVVHEPQSNWSLPNVFGLQADSNIKLRVNWNSKAFPIASKKCAPGCQVFKGSCLCEVDVDTSVVFTNASQIPSVQDVLSNLFIGSLRPSEFDGGTYRLAFQDASSGLFIYVRTRGVFDHTTIFEVRSQGGRVQTFANVRSMVRIGSFMFRNPPNFMRHEERNLRDAEYEVDAFLEHLLYHQNTAPFVADFMIKRFVTSNPSPAYISAVSQAFKSGTFSGIGSGKYGDMAATISAVLLHRDAMSTAARADFSFGKFREPLLKLLHVMRSLNLVTKAGLEIHLQNLGLNLAQEPYNSPTVFNFYQSEYRSSGAVENSGLYSPEAQILNFPMITRFLNGLISLVEVGLGSCFTSFGMNLRPQDCSRLKSGVDNPMASNSGYLNYTSLFNGLTAPAIVGKLDLLLSGGRLQQERREILVNAYNSISRNSSPGKALMALIEAFIAVPEFQTTATAPQFQVEPPKASKPVPLYDASKYKAIVYVFLSGGMDSYNLLVPHSQCSSIDLYDQYEDIRTDAAIPKNSLLQITAPVWGTTQPCKVFGVNPKMPFLHKLYNSSEAAFISNVGTLVEPMTKVEFLSSTKKRPIGLFAHNVQQGIIRRVYADSFSAKGVLGRISDHFTSRRLPVASYSTTGSFASVLEGNIGVSEPQVILDPVVGVETFDKDGLNPNLQQYVLNVTRRSSPSIFADTWNDMISTGISKSSYLKSVLDESPLSSAKLNSLTSSIGYQLKHVSKVIASRSTLKSSLDLFNVEMGGFDTHNSFTDFGNNMAIIDAALDAFVDEMKRQNMWDKVTIVVSSDFGRTLGSNGRGTDHAWAGNTFFLGGAVRGGQILGKYPSNLDVSGELNIGNGRLLPTTPWESIWNGISQWLGIENAADLNKILPNRPNFVNGNHLFTKDMIFKAPTTQAPTTQAPTTKAPTTQAPTTKAPTTKAPTTKAPTTKAPTTQ